MGRIGADQGGDFFGGARLQSQNGIGERQAMVKQAVDDGSIGRQKLEIRCGQREDIVESGA